MPVEALTGSTSQAPAERLAPGDRAPDVTVLDAQGRPVALSEIWRRGPVVLTFLRHFG